MFERFDEAELLAFIEDGLDPEAAGALRKRLSADPRALHLIEALRRDRAVLCSEPEPEMPADLLRELEPVMARPMLMPPAPADKDWRRRYRQRRRIPVRFAAAAVVLLAAFAGVWASVVAIGSFLDGRPDRLVAMEADAARPIAMPGAPAGDLADPWPADGLIHHHAPMTRIPPGAFARTDGDQRGSPPARWRGDEPTFAAAEFMLVVQGELEDVESALQRAVAGGEAALVRNFSYEEAEFLAERLRLGEAAQLSDQLEDLAEAWAGEAPSTPRRRPDQRRRAAMDEARRLARQIQREQRDDGAFVRSRQLAGDKQLAPSYDSQLEFSDLGASYTITIPAGRLNDLLAALAEAHITELHTRNRRAGDTAARLQDYLRARQAAGGLDPEKMVYLPVVVEAAVGAAD